MRPVAAWVAWAWTASVTARMPSTPAVVVAVNSIEPTCWSRMAARSASSRRSLTSPIMNSCPTRCASDSEARTSAAQSAPAVAVAVAPAVAVGRVVGATVGAGVAVADTDGIGLADGPTLGEVVGRVVPGGALGLGDSWTTALMQPPRSVAQTATAASGRSDGRRENERCIVLIVPCGDASRRRPCDAAGR